MPQEPPALRAFLHELQSRYHQKEFLGSDPLEFVHRYEDPYDREAIALVSALLAYGNVKQIRRSLEDLFRRMKSVSDSPRLFVRNLEDPSFIPQARAALKGFVHRFNRGEDLLLLLELLSRSWRQYGSLGGHLLAHLETEDENFERALSTLIAEWRSWAGQRGGVSFRYLLSSPADGSCCKRWCMLLRWMGRKDELDPGLWAKGSPLQSGFPLGRALRASQLVMPLDTHTGRISQYLGLTARKTLDWKAALEVTRNLSRCDPEDPTRYDFALSRLGILDLCQRRYRAEICTRCELVRVCRFARTKRHPRASLNAR